MHGLAGVFDKVRPIAEVAQGDQFAQRNQPGVSLAVGSPKMKLLRMDQRGAISAQQGKVVHQLLPAIHDVVGQKARLVFVAAHSTQRGVIVFACGRQGRQFRAAQHTAVIRQVQEMTGIEIGVMRLARTSRRVGLLGQGADPGHRKLCAQELGQFDGEMARRYLPII